MGTPAVEKRQKKAFYQASRAMNLKPDEDQIEKYDHYPAKGNPLIYLFLILAFGTLLLAAYLFLNGHWLFGSMGIVGLLILAVLTYSFGNAGLKKRIAYESGILLPAIIVNTAPVELLLMADLRTKEGQEPRYGFLKMAAPHLPNHQIVLNEKVPCVGLFGMTRKGYKRQFEARPLCCGFKDPALLKQAIGVISKAPTGNRNFRTEWEMLYKLRDKIGASMKSGNILIFDNNLNGAGF